MMRSFLLALALLAASLPSNARAQTTPQPGAQPAAESTAESTAWIDELRAIPIQDGGRVMPLDTYAQQLAVQLTGRARWRADRGPEAYAGREPIQLFCDLLFKPNAAMSQKLIAIENRPFKTKVGLDPLQEFFTPMQVASCQGINQQLMEFGARRDLDSSAPPLPDQKKALELSSALDRIAQFSSRTPLPLVANGDNQPFLRVGPVSGEPGTEAVQAALAAFAKAYTAGAPLDGPAKNLREAITHADNLPERDAKAIHYELFYNAHRPWRMAAYAYGLAIVVFGLSRLFLRKPLLWLAVLLGVWGVAEHTLGTGLRVLILGRAPVSNTYESLLWMGLVGIVIGLLFQIFNRRAYYLFAGVCAAFASVLFAGLVPMQDQTNALPAVLRSNYWLTIHVLTIVASYGVLAVASVLGHAFLFKNILFGKTIDVERDAKSKSAPLVVQTYRSIQIGLILLTAGTILGGVWAADSWGRFWGWDPKETWALISIVIYFAVLHARYVGWLRDFGLAAAAVLGFAAIVWTFYGVNYVMATGLHSYGFGSGGEVWVGAWAIAEILFLIACRVRYLSLRRAASADHHHDTPTGTTPATS